VSVPGLLPGRVLIIGKTIDIGGGLDVGVVVTLN
jgi:hypothetical protein